MADNFDNYSMKVQARVDMPSNKDIDAQIRKLEKSISKLKVSGQFDDTALKNLTNQLNSLKATVSTANFSPTALTELTNQVNRALQNINIGNINVGNIGSQAQQVGQQIGQQINQGVSKHIDVNSAIEKAYNKYLSLTGKKSSAIFKGQLDEMSSVLQNDIKLFEKFNSSIDSIDDAGLLRETVNELSNIKTEATSLAKTTDILNNSINHSFNLDTTSDQEEIKEIITITDNYGRELDELNSKLLSTSKMMNTQGKLITLFHGSPNEFDSFKINNRGRFEDALGVGGYFFDNPSDSIGYGNVSQWFANVEKIFDTSAKLSAEEIQSVYDKYKTQIKDILDIDNLLDFTSDVNKNPIDSLKNLSSRMGFDSSFLMKELGYDAIIDRGATSTYVILDENKIIKANSALKEQVSLITDIQEAKKMEENADPKRNWNKSVMDAMKAKSESSKQEISLSNSSTSTVIQNEEKKQQAIQETENKIKGLSELKITPDNAIDINGLTKAEDILDKVRAKYEQFGQVTFKNIELDADGNLKSFRVNIQQTNGDLKETRNFLMEISDDAKKVKFADDTIKGTENVVRHLNEQKDATDEIIKEEQKLANAMADVREKSEQNRQTEEKRQQMAQNKAINKALEEEYNQKQKLIAQEEKLAQVTAEKADKIQLSTDFTKLTTDYQKFGIVSQEVENNLKELKLAQESVVNAKGTDRLATEIEKYDTALEKAKSSWKELSATQVSLSQRTSQMTSMQEWMRKNSAATKLCGDRVRELIAECQTCNKVRFDQIKNEFKQIQVEAGKAGKLGSGFLEGLVTQGKKFAQWVGVSGFVTRLGMAVKDTGRNVIELDDALTNISYTMDVTKSQLEDIGNSSLETAINLKTSASNVLDAVKTYANATETAESILNKAKPTIMMSNVSGMDTQQTVDILQGTMEQFDLAEDKLMHISDVMQTVSANMPYDFAKGLRELSEGIQASGSVAKDAGYDLENYTALLGTLIAKTRQSGSELGRSLRTMFVRTTKASSSALANGEVTEEDLSNAEKALRRVGIEVRSDIDTFKSFDEIMGELYNKVDSLSEVDLSNIAYEVASTRQTNVFKMMIKAYGEYQDMAEKAYSADGATLANQEKYAESLKGKLEGLGAVWEKIGDDALDSSLLKGLVDAGTEVSTLIEKFGLLKTAIVGIGAYAGFKNAG